MRLENLLWLNLQMERGEILNVVLFYNEVEYLER